ncbi:MAG TPA: hypothetical protein PKC18_18605, partial [Lacipirellulaceae bacterium]|nr:hypothetical protein [Lacipirellulaceae bacterium]
MRRSKVCTWLAGLALVTSAAAAQAVELSFEATDNATVQAAGPRPGGNGKNFLNVQGSNNNNFASFGVADFNFGAGDPVGGTVLSLSNVTLELTQSNAAFSLAGPFSVYYTAALEVDIQPTNTALQYQSGFDGEDSVHADLLPLVLLGSGDYQVLANGTVDVVNLALTSGLETELIGAINAGTTWRLVITPDAPTTAATYAGFSSNMFAGPTLKFDAVLDGGTFAPGDFNQDGFVNGDDLTIWTAGFIPEGGATVATGDANGDGNVDGADFV